MRRAAAMLAIVATACGADVVVPSAAPSVSLAAGVTEVEFGRPFEVRVDRAWPEGDVPEPWNDAALAPLDVRPIAVASAVRDGVVAESRVFEARAFTRGDVTVAPPLLRTLSRGGETREARGAAFTVRVRPALDPSRHGPASRAELPRGPLGGGPPWTAWVFAAGAAATAAWFATRRRRPPAVAAAAPPAPPAPAGPTAADRALGRLAALRGTRPGDDAARLAFHVEVASALREFVGERYAACAPETTTEELLAADALRHAVADGPRAELRSALRACDAVKFATARPGAAECADVLAGAVRFVEACAAETAAAATAPGAGGAS